uniref:Ferredoxin-fold anticodon binding domain containing 1 n=1 Tax=Oryzias latipes TaxID=8090 RepID=A0A3P9KG43_ORYLA
MSHSRTVLLVGEGNFSFSASLCWMGKVTATCPQRQEEVLLFEGAASNISSITDSGGSVLFEVDCTRLAECPALRGRLFDRVLFNFPHCGRKSGVKKNKELLRNFFLSSVQVLTKDGEVHVSLCNGQGGTPADEPRREWHNSWQVVAMAAEAGLILSAVYPFDSNSPQGYKCTGYRSQDKGFRVEKALLHVFTRSQEYASPVRVEVEESVEGEKIHYSAPAELSDFLFRKFLCLDSVHPVKLVQDFLLERLREKWPVSMTTESIPYFIPAKRLQASRCGVDISQCYWVLPKDFRFGDDVGSLHTLTHLWSVSSTKEDRAKSKRAENFWSASLDLEVDLDFYVLRPSLLPYAEELLVTKQNRKKDVGPQRKSEEAEERDGLEGNEFSEGLQDAPGTLYGVSEVVFRNVPISLWGLPAFHELVLRGVFPSECEPVKQLGHQLDSLLAPFDVSITTEGEVLHLTAQPMGILGFVKFVNNRKASEMNEGRDSVKRRRETWRLRRSVSEAGEAADRTRTARTFQQNPGLRKMRKPGMTLKPQRLAQSQSVEEVRFGLPKAQQPLNACSPRASVRLYSATSPTAMRRSTTGNRCTTCCTGQECKHGNILPCTLSGPTHTYGYMPCLLVYMPTSCKQTRCWCSTLCVVSSPSAAAFVNSTSTRLFVRSLACMWVV